MSTNSCGQIAKTCHLGKPTSMIPDQKTYQLYPRQCAKPITQNFQLNCIKEYMTVPVETREAKNFSKFIMNIKKSLFGRN